MTCLNSNDPAHAVPAGIVHELDALLSFVCDEALTDDQRCRLNQLLDQSAAARRHYLQQIAIHSALVTTAGSYVRPELAIACGEDRRNGDDYPRANESERRVPASIAQRSLLQLGPETIRRSTARSWATVAISICLVGILIVSIRRNSAREQSPPPAVGAPAVASLPDEIRQLVVEVTYVSPSVRWQDPNASFALASRIRTGQSLVLEQGQVELTYATGAKLLLTGPSEFIVESGGGKLRRGELVARVPEAGHGFKIETPHGRVIDLGTEFGVVVDDFGVSQVSVFEGKVETWPLGATDTNQRIELTSGRGLQWTGKGMIPMDATGRRYSRLGEETLADLHPTTASTSFDDDFRGGALSSDWRTLGLATLAFNGLHLGGLDPAPKRSYLITRREFDPSQGAIRIKCDVRFLDTTGSDDASLAILTRSADELSNPGLPWQDMLARFVRCSFRMDPNSGEGLLEAGTKYEADRELSNNSWGGFSRPQTGALYQLELHDDGLNVTFTVALADNPSIRKTISCRSLFRGNHNFIAFEGSTADVLIERLQIVQEGVANIAGGELARGDVPRSPNPTVPAALEKIEKLIPTRAELLVSDRFDGAELNPAIWKTLGDVAVQDGRVQLGLHNEDEHIDTWRQRPYLLTKRQFDPQDGTLVVVGKVAFAENYLHGYGGSFAVMTRADDALGAGPGWENSILRRGLRSNFWPAALGFDQSLQIHEKPNPNTLSLLAAEGFQIDPRSRSYLFCVKDEGTRATLTFVDAENPDIRETISHPTMLTAGFSGHIGFESCWGSPVLLDDIRIFQGKPGDKTSAR